jgi:hypothetical protein
MMNRPGSLVLGDDAFAPIDGVAGRCPTSRAFDWWGNAVPFPNLIARPKSSFGCILAESGFQHRNLGLDALAGWTDVNFHRITMAYNEIRDYLTRISGGLR